MLSVDAKILQTMITLNEESTNLGSTMTPATRETETTAFSLATRAEFEAVRSTLDKTLEELDAATSAQRREIIILTGILLRGKILLSLLLNQINVKSSLQRMVTET